MAALQQEREEPSNDVVPDRETWWHFVQVPDRAVGAASEKRGDRLQRQEIVIGIPPSLSQRAQKEQRRAHKQLSVFDRNQIARAKPFAQPQSPFNESIRPARHALDDAEDRHLFAQIFEECQCLVEPLIGVERICSDEIGQHDGLSFFLSIRTQPVEQVQKQHEQHHLHPFMRSSKIKQGIK